MSIIGINGYSSNIFCKIVGTVIIASARTPNSKRATLSFKKTTRGRKGPVPKFAYEKKIVERFGGQQELGLVVPVPATVSAAPDTKEAAN
jgi:hypothetical protein